MTDSVLTSSVENPGISWRIHAWWAAFVALPFLVAVVASSRTTPLPGQCSGIEWGCELGGSGAAADTLLLYGPAIATIWIVGHCVILHRQRDRRRRSLALQPV